MYRVLLLLSYLISTPINAQAHPHFILMSPAFQYDANIPRIYTCRGKSISPPLRWSGVPKNAKSLVLIVSDPDAALRKVFYHWGVYNIPPSANGFKTAAQLIAPIQIAKNSYGNAKYQGPCPSRGNHRYQFHLYALDIILPVQEMSVDQLRTLVHNHIIDAAETMGRSSS